MGMFNTIKVPCPKCGKIEECQTKSGSCRLEEFDFDKAPVEDLADVNRHAPFTCAECGTLFDVAIQCIAIPRIVRKE